MHYAKPRQEPRCLRCLAARTDIHMSPPAQPYTSRGYCNKYANVLMVSHGPAWRGSSMAPPGFRRADGEEGARGRREGGHPRSPITLPLRRCAPPSGGQGVTLAFRHGHGDDPLRGTRISHTFIGWRISQNVPSTAQRDRTTRSRGVVSPRYYAAVVCGSEPRGRRSFSLSGAQRGGLMIWFSPTRHHYRPAPQTQVSSGVR